MKPETELKNKVIKFLRQYCEYQQVQCHIVPIESNLTQQGIPDVYCNIAGIVGWIECKDGDEPLSPLQIAFAKAEELANGYVLVIREYNESQLEEIVQNCMERVDG